ncbi:putative ribonuclease H-like domain-containing protein [Tanacetum coccineum]
MYSFDLKNVVPSGGLTCLFAKATNLWHRRLGHINFKTMNKLVRGNLVRGLPSKLFENDQTCVACQKGKQHKASCNTKTSYCLVVTDDFSRFSWVFFLATKDETPEILKNFITGIENQTDHKGIKREFSVARTPQQNGVAERKNKTQIEAVRTMLADSKLSTTFWAEAVNTGRKDALSFMRPFGCLVTILNTLDHLDPPFSSSSKDSLDAGFKPSGEEEMKDAENPGNENGNPPKGKDSKVLNNVVDENIVYGCADDPNIPDLEEIGRFSDAEDDGVEADMTNLDTHISVSPIPTTRIHKDHPVEQIIRDIHSAPQTRRMTKSVTEHAMFSSLPNGKRAIGTKWVFRNKKDERGIVIKNKARLVAQGYTQEEGIDYHEVFAPVARIKAIRLFLAYASFKDFVVYQMDIKSAFLYVRFKMIVYVCQPPGFEDPDFPDRVYKKLCTKFEKMMHKKFQMSSIGELTFFLGPQVKQKEDGIFISQDMYVTEILKKFGFSDAKTASTPMETHKPLLKDADEAEYVAASSCYGQVLWIQNQLLDYRDSNKKRLIQMIKIYTDKNVADLLTKAFDKGIEVNAGDSKLMLLGINLLLLGKVNASRHNLLLLVIVDFLNASSIKYALTVNPTIYTSCREQFWSTAKAKTVNGEVQLQALVDRKKIVVIEASIRRDLQLEDTNGVDCLPNAIIFEQLTLMGYEKLSQKLTFYKAFFSPQWKFLIHTILQCLSAKTTTWNEFSSNVAFAIICLANNQKFNFSKYIFESMMKNLDSAVKFLMKPKKKDTQIPQSSVPSNNIVEEAINEENVPTHSNDPLLSGKDRLKLKELMALCTNLQNRVGLSARVISSEDKGLGEEDASKQGRKIHDIDANEDITLENFHDEDMFDTGVFNDEEVFTGQDMAEKEVSTADPITTAGEVVTTTNVEASTASLTTATITIVKLTLAQTLAELKSERPKTKGVVMQEPSETTTTTTVGTTPKAKRLAIQEQEQVSIPITSLKDKGKGIMVEEPLKMKKKDQVLFDEQEAIRLQA